MAVESPGSMGESLKLTAVGRTIPEEGVLYRDGEVKLSTGSPAGTSSCLRDLKTMGVM